MGFDEKGERVNMNMEKKRKRTHLVLLTIVWIILLWPDKDLKNYLYETYGIHTDYVGEEETGVTTDLAEGVEVSQTFEAAQDGLKEVDVRAATYQRINDSLINITILDDLGNVLYEEQSQATEWEDNTYLTFQFESQENSKNRLYTITFSGIDGVLGDSAPTLWYTSEHPDGYAMQWNGAQQDGTLMLKLTYDNMNYTYEKTLAGVLLGLAIVASYMVVLLKKKEVGEEV
jgi:hypothetical protein